MTDTDFDFVPPLVEPRNIAALPRDKHDRPIPWFVAVDADGVPDFRVIRAGGIRDAMRFGWCWVCGKPRGRHAAFVIGPMCCVNRVSAEPPCHLSCAVYSARACPFLSTPSMARRERNLPANRVDPAGQMIDRNPGVALVWSSRTWAPFTVPPGPNRTAGVLFDVGDPTATSWWCRGRPATGDEIRASIDTGLPILRAQAERDGPRAAAQLERQTLVAQTLIPA